MSPIRIPRKKHENKEQPIKSMNDAGVLTEEIRAERSEEAEFEDARDKEELPEHYRTRIDKY